MSEMGIFRQSSGIARIADCSDKWVGVLKDLP